MPIMSVVSYEAKLLTSPSTMPPAYLRRVSQEAAEGHEPLHTTCALFAPLQRQHRREQHALVAARDKRSSLRNAARAQVRQQAMRLLLHGHNVELFSDGLRGEGGAVSGVGAGHQASASERSA